MLFDVFSDCLSGTQKNMVALYCLVGSASESQLGMILGEGWGFQIEYVSRYGELTERNEVRLEG